MKRGSVGLWLLLLVASEVAGWGSALRAQEIDKPLIDDVSQQVPKAVSKLPEPLPRPLTPPAPVSEKQVMLEATLFELKLDQLPAVKDESSKHERLTELARTLKWQTLHPKVDWKTRDGFNVRDENGLIWKSGTILSQPKLITLDGQEASLVTGGEIPVLDAPQKDKAVIRYRPFGFSMTCLPSVRDAQRVRLELKIEHTKVTTTSPPANLLDEVAALVSGDGKKETLPPVVSGQTMSLIADLAFGETYIVALPSNEDPANKVVLFAIKPEVVAQGKGVNSDAGVTGQIVLDDKATQTKLTAKSLSVEVPQVHVGMSNELGQRGLLVRQHKLGESQFRLRVVAQPVVLEAIKNPDSKHKNQADVTLRAESQAAAEQLSAARQTLEKDDILFFLPMPEGVKQVADADLRRVFEHASIRAEIEVERRESAQNTAEVLEIAVGQKSVRVPINRQIVALLPTPKGNYSDYVSIFHSEQRGIRQIGGLTVFFVTEAAIELEALIKETESSANVTVIEVKESALLRGTVDSAEQKKAVIELAEQFYPKVLDQLRVGKNVTHEKIGIDFENGKEPITTVTTVTERTEPLRSSQAPPLSRLSERQDASRRLSESAPKPQPSPIKQAKAEEVEVLASGAKRLKKLAPHKLPSVEELKELRDDVKGLRRDVQRLSEALQRDRQMAGQGDSDKTDANLPVVNERVRTGSDLVSDAPSYNALQATADFLSKNIPGPTRLNPDDIRLLDDSVSFVRTGLQHPLTLGVRPQQSVRVQFGRKISRVDGFDAGIASVKPLSADTMLISGLNPGITTLVVQTDLNVPLTGRHDWPRLTIVVGECDVNAKDTPLRDVIASVAERSTLNIRLDADALEEEGVTAGVPVSLSLKNVSALQALRNCVELQSLTVVIDDGVLVVTNERRARGRLIVAAYPVADLVVPMGPQPAKGEQPKTNEQALMQLLNSTIEPNSWSEVGGEGSMKFVKESLSLVIRQSQPVHAEIRELLSQLRQLQAVQLVFETQLVALPKALVPQSIEPNEEGQSTHILIESAKKQFIEKWQSDRRANIVMSPKVTLFQGQVAWIETGALKLLLRGSASVDHRAVQVGVGLNGESFESVSRQHHQRLKNGETLLLDVTEDLSEPARLLKQIGIATGDGEARNILKSLKKDADQRVLLLVTPHVIQVTEDEEVLGVEAR